MFFGDIQIFDELTILTIRQIEGDWFSFFIQNYQII